MAAIGCRRRSQNRRGGGFPPPRADARYGEARRSRGEGGSRLTGVRGGFRLQRMRASIGVPAAARGRCTQYTLKDATHHMHGQPELVERLADVLVDWAKAR